MGSASSYASPAVGRYPCYNAIAFILDFTAAAGLGHQFFDYVYFYFATAAGAGITGMGRYIVAVKAGTAVGMHREQLRLAAKIRLGATPLFYRQVICFYIARKTCTGRKRYFQLAGSKAAIYGG